eukprot:5614579-Prorocentrum_lima.AAC.1
MQSSTTQVNTAAVGPSQTGSNAQVPTTSVEPLHTGKAPPPVLGQANGGKAAPVYFSVAGNVNHLPSPPPPANVTLSMKKTEGKVCVLKAAASSSTLGL